MKKIDVDSLSFGSDAEVFLKDATGRPFPACGLIGGTKEEPLKLDDTGCMVQEDNVMLEFNVPVSRTSKEWARNLQLAMDLAFAKIPPTMYPVMEATQNFELALLNNPQAQRFGCEPDFNAWTQQQNPRPQPIDPTMRSAAAHVHIGWKDPEDLQQRCRLIQLADIFVTLPSVWESPDRKRRQLYGKAGAFRPKEYGVEHRVLDNYWLASRDNQLNVWSRYQDAITAFNEDFPINEDLAASVQNAINTYDVSAAEKLHAEAMDRLFGGKKSKKAVTKLENFYAGQYKYAGTGRAGQIVWDDGVVVRAGEIQQVVVPRAGE